MEENIHAPRERAPLFKASLLAGLLGAAVIFCAWFLLSRTAKSVGLAILIATVGVFAIEVLVNLFIRKLGKVAKRCINIALILINVLIFFSATVYTLAPTQLFYPHFDEESYNELQSFENAEELKIETPNGALSGWLVHNAENDAPTVIYFYGNGENASARALKLLSDGSIDVFKGCNFAIFDYPAYGKSEGELSHETLRESGVAAYDYIASRSDVDKDKIILFGYSLGTGIANYVASERDAAGLMLMAPYASGYDLYNGFVNVFHGPLRLLVSYKMDAAEYAESINIVPLIMASRNDEYVSFETSQRLSDAYPQGCDFRAFDDIAHNDFWGNDLAYSYIEEYIEGVISK